GGGGGLEGACAGGGCGGGCANHRPGRGGVFVMGDARTTSGDPAVDAFAEIRQRAGQVYWLTPEPRRYWNDGDSVIGRYAPLCAQVQECRTLAQIADFVRSLAVGEAPRAVAGGAG